LKRCHNNWYNHFITKSLKQAIFLIRKDDELFPTLLRETSSCPKSLFCRGVLPDKNEICIAVVGTRKATRDGLITAKTISYDLAEAGACVISGLALGIDGAAHEGALAAGGKTYAVLANGLDSIYPRQHENLGEKIIESGGGLISEYPEGTPSLPHQFLERNRIVSGMSIATVVIEAPERSGSLATARLALEEGRDVFVVPGPTSNRNYRGSHFLIREGARLVTSASDILGDLGFEIKRKEPELTDIQTLVMNALKDRAAFSVDKISEFTKLEARIVSSALTFLTLEGLVEEKNGEFKLKE